MFLELEGVDNARDLGGLPAAGGREVVPGLLVRSGLLADATVEDARFLMERMGLRAVVDLRTPDEQAGRPDPSDLFEGVAFIDVPVIDMGAFGVTHEGGRLRGAWRLIRTVKRHPERIMIDVYERMVLDEGSRRSFRRLFDVLLDSSRKADSSASDASGPGCVLWHCSSGKDRAGLAAALVLSALGVPREAVEADYLASNGHMGTRSQGVRDTLAAYHLEKRLEGSIRVLTSADARFLDAAFGAMERGFGGVEGYLAQAIGLTFEERAALEARYLRPAVEDRVC